MNTKRVLALVLALMMTLTKSGSYTPLPPIL